MTTAAVKALRDRTRAKYDTLMPGERGAEDKIITACVWWLRARRNTTSGSAGRIDPRDVAIITSALAHASKTGANA